MATKKLRILSIIGLATLVGLVGAGAFAAGAGHGPFAGHFAGHAGGGHCASHGPLGMHFRMMKLVDDLQLNPEQKTRVEAIHQILMGKFQQHHEHHGEHARVLAARLGQGPMSTEEVRPVIDQHVEQIRATAYQISEELVALLNSLDETQRATVLAHLQEVHGTDAGAGVVEP